MSTTYNVSLTYQADIMHIEDVNKRNFYLNLNKFTIIIAKFECKMKLNYA